MATDSRKRLALAIIDFLSTSQKDGTLQAEDADSIDIASNCIAEAFHVDPTDQAAMKDAVGGQNLLGIYGVYEKLKGKTGAASSSSSTATSGTAPKVSPADASPDKGGPTDASEKLKGQGNAAMQKKDYAAAVDSYTSALEISPLNPIYLSNRAAAYSAQSQHEFAKNDAELATAADPKYTKAWSRLGLARYALGDYHGAQEAYQSGIDAEGNGGSEAMKKGLETARRKVAESGNDGADDDGDDDAMASSRGAGAGSGGGGMPDLAGLASMLGGAGGGGGGGGMPDLSALAGMFGGGAGGGGGGMPDIGAMMQNPMMRQMAQSVMSNPEMMSNLMNNPQLRGMADRFGGGGGGAGGQGGGMPDLGALMSDPSVAEMARNFMGGAGGGGGAGGAGGAGAGRGAGSQ